MAGVVLHRKRPAVPLSDSHLLLHFLPAARLQSAIHPILSKLGVIHYFIFPPLVAFSFLLLQFQNRFWSRGNGKQEKHLHWSLNLKEFSDKLFRPLKTSFSSYPSAVIGLQGLLDMDKEPRECSVWSSLKWPPHYPEGGTSPERGTPEAFTDLP